MLQEASGQSSRQSPQNQRFLTFYDTLDSQAACAKRSGLCLVTADNLDAGIVSCQAVEANDISLILAC